MNKVHLMGRVVRDPEVKYSQGDNPQAVARYTLAVNRIYKRQGEADADFISCVAFGRAGEFAAKYLHQGIKIVISGRLLSGSYTNKDGNKVYTTDVVVEEQEFAESKGAGNGSDQNSSKPISSEIGDGFMNIPEDIDKDLPFN